MVAMVLVDIVIGLVIAGAVVFGFMRKRRHPELPPTPEALAEQQNDPEYKITPGVGWGGIGGDWH